MPKIKFVRLERISSFKRHKMSIVNHDHGKLEGCAEGESKVAVLHAQHNALMLEMNCLIKPPSVALRPPALRGLSNGVLVL